MSASQTDCCLTGKREQHLLPVTEMNMKSKSSESVLSRKHNTDVSFSNSLVLMLLYQDKLCRTGLILSQSLLLRPRLQEHRETEEHRCRLRKLTNTGVVFVSFQTSLTETDFRKQLCVLRNGAFVTLQTNQNCCCLVPVSGFSTLE